MEGEQHAQSALPPSSNNPVLVTNPLTSGGMLFSTSPIFVLKAVIVTKLL